jgi:hypothetical protein
MPWSASLFKATAWAAPLFGGSPRTQTFRRQLRHHDLPLKDRGTLFLILWAAFILLFFAFPTRQEYYVLPALPALALLIAGWLANDAIEGRHVQKKKASPFPSHTFEVPEARSNFRITVVILFLYLTLSGACLIFVLNTSAPASGTDLARLLTQNPSDYALSMGHFLDLTGPAITLFRTPLTITAAALFLSALAAFEFRRKDRVHAANLALAAGAFTFLLAAHLGLQTFAPVLTSAQLAQAIAPQVHPQDLICIHGEYEAGSTLAFYLQRPNTYAATPDATNFIHILEGRSSNLWYGSFFPDAPKIFETRASLAAKWQGPQRIFLWQSLTNSDAPPSQLPPLPGPVYILVKSGGKEIVSNQRNR